MNDELDFAARHAPIINFDIAEPFFPIRIGVTLFEKPGPSPSFRRNVDPGKGRVAVEYAIFWHWDIQHLYEMEHVWVYVDSKDRCVDCEGSFHGFYLKGLLPTKSNRNPDRTRPVLYSQPGKHAFAPMPMLFKLLPDYKYATRGGAGSEGLLITRILDGRMEKTDEIDAAATAYLKTKAFSPTGKFRPWEYPQGIFRPWPEVDAEIPKLILEELARIRTA
jgi:hypothetical protein